MTRSPVSRTIQEVMALLAPMVQWFTRIPELRATYGSEICDFGSGNPQEGAIEGYARALKRWADPQEPDWFAYKVSEPKAQAEPPEARAKPPKSAASTDGKQQEGGRRRPSRP